MKVTGLINKCDFKNKNIGLIFNGSLQYFHMRNGLLKTFKPFLYKGNYISFVCKNKLVVHGGVSVREVEYLIRIFEPSNNSVHSFYDKNLITNSLTNFFNDFENTLFVDFEMTMPGYKKQDKKKPAEIIWAGYVLYDKNGKELDSFSSLVKPTIHNKISDRTYKFLSLSESDFVNAIKYKEFYEKFRFIIEKYKPAIITWGKNDKIVLENSYVINKLPSLNEESRFVNLLKLCKTHYELKQDPGLFHMVEYYYGKTEQQAHDPLDDARATVKVFNKFVIDVKNHTKIDFQRFNNQNNPI